MCFTAKRNPSNQTWTEPCKDSSWLCSFLPETSKKRVVPSLSQQLVRDSFKRPPQAGLLFNHQGSSLAGERARSKNQHCKHMRPQRQHEPARNRSTMSQHCRTNTNNQNPDWAKLSNTESQIVRCLWGVGCPYLLGI